MTRHRERNSRKTDPVPDKPQSVNNGSFPEFKGKEVFQFHDQSNESTRSSSLEHIIDVCIYMKLWDCNLNLVMLLFLQII